MDNAFATAQQQINQIRDLSNKSTCQRCKTAIVWAENQWKRNCPKCGIVLIRSSCLPQDQIKCFACMDTGVINYYVQEDDVTGLYGAACDFCTKGQDYDIIRFKECLKAPPITAIIADNKRRAHVK
jgi:predicted RNA-binding Zn-ribbon protein involved in translation (DUF1610 family)